MSDRILKKLKKTWIKQKDEKDRKRKGNRVAHSGRG